MITPKTCILCRWMSLNPGSPAYSEWTPAEDWSSACAKDHWYMLGQSVTAEDYVRNLLSAENCPDFEPSPLVEKIQAGK